MRTADARYALLEARGTWFDGRSAKPVEVIVKFGEATLTLYRIDGMPLAHWALASLCALPDTAGASYIVLTPDEESDERLTIADPDMIGAIRAVCPDLHRLRRRAPPGQRRRLLLWGGGALAAFLLIVFVLIPAIAEELALLIPPAREEALGRVVLGQVETMFGGFGSGLEACETAEGKAALDRMLARLGPHFDSHVPVKLRVLDHPMVNAVALPGGYVIVFRGLLEEAGSAEEVAGVLAHEIGHVLHRDPTRLALRSAGTAGLLGLLVGDMTGGALIGGLTELLITAAYSREAEAEADRTAHRILAAAELPLEPFAGFFLRLADKHGRPNALLSHLASHPDLVSRAEAARRADRVHGRPFIPLLDDQDWVALRNICDREDQGGAGSIPRRP